MSSVIIRGHEQESSGWPCSVEEAKAFKAIAVIFGELGALLYAEDFAQCCNFCSLSVSLIDNGKSGLIVLLVSVSQMCSELVFPPCLAILNMSAVSKGS